MNRSFRGIAGDDIVLVNVVHYKWDRDTKPRINIVWYPASAVRPSRCLFYYFFMRFQRSVNTAGNAGTLEATKHNDYKRPGASMRCCGLFSMQLHWTASAFRALHASSPSLPSKPGLPAPFVKCRIDLKNEKRNSRLDEVRRGIVIASPRVRFERSSIHWVHIVISLSEII